MFLDDIDIDLANSVDDIPYAFDPGNGKVIKLLSDKFLKATTNKCHLLKTLYSKLRMKLLLTVQIKNYLVNLLFFILFNNKFDFDEQESTQGSLTKVKMFLQAMRII